MKIFDLILDIFLENREKKVPKFVPEDLTNHYIQELWSLDLDHVYIASRYSHIEDSISRYKYFSDRSYGDILADMYRVLLEFYEIPRDQNLAIVPIPMHWSRYILRGFDHTGHLTKILSKKSNIPYKNLLSTAWRPHQSKLSRQKRLENKKNSFRIHNHTFVPETVLLLDDVISTGSTANEAAKVLKKAGVKKVIGIFLASNL